MRNIATLIALLCIGIFASALQAGPSANPDHEVGIDVFDEMQKVMDSWNIHHQFRGPPTYLGSSPRDTEETERTWYNGALLECDSDHLLYSDKWIQTFSVEVRYDS